MQIQVDKSHYEFGNYMAKSRWSSLWHQVDEVLKFSPDSVLEIGPGPGIFKSVLSKFVLNVKSLDIDPELSPDYVASADAMPFDDKSYDVVCAFQMLEHVPYEKSIVIFNEMTRVARKSVVISLPDAATRWPFAIYIPRLGLKWFTVPKPTFRPKVHQFDGEHYWEINKIGFPLAKILNDLCMSSSVKLARTYRVNENSYHRFFVFEKLN